MVRLSQAIPTVPNLEASRRVTRWTRRYAQTRSVPVLVGVAVNLLLFLGIWTVSANLGKAYRSGQTGQFCVLAVVEAALMGLVLWLSVPRWGGRWLERLGWRYYDREGAVTIPCILPRDRMKKLGAVVSILFGAAILTHVQFGLYGYTTIEHMQPLSALYIVPFTVFLALSTRSYFQLLFPLLYTLHALLLLAGVPMRFWSEPGLDVPIAVGGYMVFAALVAHVYNRYALSRLKEAATPQGGEVQGDERA